MKTKGEISTITISLLVATALLLRYYRSPETPWSISWLIYISWFLGFAGVFLLPFDIGDVQTYGESAPWVLEAWKTYGESAPWVLEAWKFIYWTTFALTWVVLPITFSYLESGYFTPKDRLKDALKAQIRGALIALAALVAFVIYLLAQHYTFIGTEGFLMALGNTYGLLMIVVLLGNGVIEVPRRLWASSFPARELQRLYFRSSLIDAELHDAVCVLADVEAEVTAVREQLRINPPRMNGEETGVVDACMKVLSDARASFRHRPEDMTLGMLLPKTSFGLNGLDHGGGAAGGAGEGGGRSPTSTIVTRLASLHCRLKKAQIRVQVLKMQRDAVVSQVEETEAIAQGTFQYPEEISEGAGCLAWLSSHFHYAIMVIKWYWKTTVSLWVLRLLAIACWIMTLCFIWSEIVLGSPLALSPFGALQQAVGQSSPFAIQLAIAIPLAYVSLCTYRSLFKFKLFGEFSLQGPHQSLSRPLLVNAQYLIRLQFPLAYNFLLLLRSPSSQETAFRQLMSNMAVVPLLGSDFNTYAPLIMVLLSGFTFFHGYARLLRIVGAYHEDLISGEEQEEMIQQGRSLARRRRYPLPSSNGGGMVGLGVTAIRDPSSSLRAGVQELGVGGGRTGGVYTALKT